MVRHPVLANVFAMTIYRRESAKGVSDSLHQSRSERRSMASSRVTGGSLTETRGETSSSETNSSARALPGRLGEPCIAERRLVVLPPGSTGARLHRTTSGARFTAGSGSPSRAR
jgi:hypothetical protein